MAATIVRQFPSLQDKFPSQSGHVSILMISDFKLYCNVNGYDILLTASVADEYIICAAIANKIIIFAGVLVQYKSPGWDSV